MTNRVFDQVLIIQTSQWRYIASVEEALAILLDAPPLDCALRNDAFEACISALKGDVPPVVARDAFVSCAKLIGTVAESCLLRAPTIYLGGI
jgi:hypothetical protein